MQTVLAGIVALTLGAIGPAPAYPPNTKAAPFFEALVPLEVVSNGCGPGRAASARPRPADIAAYGSFKVDFRLACDLQDAAYRGAAVADPVNGGYVDAFDWTRAQVDAKFAADEQTLCRRDISGDGSDAQRALDACVRDVPRLAAAQGAGMRWFVVRPHVSGKWRSRKHGVWTLTQHSRHVTASWPGGDFDGTILVGRGPPIINGLGPTFRMVFTVESAQRMDVVSGGELLALRRA
jgi:hypothetical protein